MRRFTWGRFLFLAFAMLCVLLPLGWTLLASLGVLPNNDVSPPVWSWPIRLDSYQEIRIEQTHFWEELVVSTLLSALTTLIVVVVSFLAAYGLARSAGRWRTVAVQSCLILACLPAMSVVFPLSEVLHFLRLHDTLLGIVAAEVAMLAPLAVYVLYGYVRSTPRELEEAAYLDGATLVIVLKDITLPVVATSIVATAAVVFVLSWNQFFLPLLLSGVKIRAIPVMMRDFFALERDFDWRIASAVVIISLVPVGLFVAATHRMLERFRLESLVDLG
jgi:multiple sugar transport system permease protein